MAANMASNAAKTYNQASMLKYVGTGLTVGSFALGVILGAYLTHKYCEDLLDQFELLFIQNVDRLSDCLIYGINYLKNMADFYKKQGC